MADSLRDELLAIDGIESADIDGSNGAPAGVRVRLSIGADPDLVGREVRRVLAVHGMRPHVTEMEPARPGPPPPPGAPGAVVALPGIETTAPTEAGGAVSLTSGGAVAEEPQAPETVETHAEEAVPGLTSVAVEEGRHGVVVKVSGLGKTVSRRTRASGAGLDESIIAAVAELVLGAETPPLLLAVHTQTLEDTDIVTVLVELDEGERRVGSAILEGGRPYAVARAAWAALSEPA